MTSLRQQGLRLCQPVGKLALTGEVSIGAFVRLAARHPIISQAPDGARHLFATHGITPVPAVVANTIAVGRWIDPMDRGRYASIRIRRVGLLRLRVRGIRRLRVVTERRPGLPRLQAIARRPARVAAKAAAQQQPGQHGQGSEPERDPPPPRPGA